MRFVVCGEALIDLVEREQVSTFESAWSALSAGGPMNTAVGLARLGAEVAFAGRVSTDRFGRQLRDHLRSNGVSLTRATMTDDPTSLAVVSLDADGKASYAFHFDGTAAFGWRRDELPRLDPAEWLHVASLATVVAPGCEALLEWADVHRGPVSFDLNVRPSVIRDPGAYWAHVEPWLSLLGRHRGIVKASDDDIAFLADVSGCTGSPVEVVAAWQRTFGFDLGVVTVGAAGASAVSATGETWAVAGHPVQVVDTVGAGDTFMAGFLDAYAASPNVATAMGAAVAAAAYVCTRPGPQPPTRAELRDFVGSTPDQPSQR